MLSEKLWGLCTVCHGVQKEPSLPCYSPLPQACLLLLGSVTLWAVSRESGAPEKLILSGVECSFQSETSGPLCCADGGTSGKTACNYSLAGVGVSQASPTSTIDTSCVYSSET